MKLELTNLRRLVAEGINEGFTFTSSDVEEVDCDEANEDNEGNIEGTVTIWAAGGRYDFTGEHMSPVLLKWNRAAVKHKRSVIDELRRKVADGSVKMKIVKRPVTEGRLLKDVFSNALMSKFGMTEQEASLTLRWLRSAGTDEANERFFDDEAGQKVLKKFNSRLNNPRKPIAQHDVPEFVETWIRQEIGLKEGITEAKGEYNSYKAWKAAIKKKHPDSWIEGDEDIAQAMVGPKPYKRGETKSVGEWDGAKGELFEAVGVSDKIRKALAAAEAGRGQSSYDYSEQVARDTRNKREYEPVLKAHGFRKQPNGKYYKTAGCGTITITQHGHWEHLGVGDTDNDKDYEGTTAKTLERHLKSLQLNEGAMYPWSSLDFDGEKVWYQIAPYIFLHTGKGKPFDVGIAMRNNAHGIETERVTDSSVKVNITDEQRGYDTAEKHSKAYDKDARRVVLKWLKANGTKPLKDLAALGQSAHDEYHGARNAKIAKAEKGKKTLPRGYTIVDGPKKGHRFVRTPDGKLIPNQGDTPYKSEQDIIDNFYIWKALNEAQEVKKFRVTWKGYGKVPPKVVGVEYFSDDNGFDKSDITAVNNLAVHDDYRTDGIADSVTIVRIK